MQWTPGPFSGHEVRSKVLRTARASTDDAEACPSCLHALTACGWNSEFEGNLFCDSVMYDILRTLLHTPTKITMNSCSGAAASAAPAAACLCLLSACVLKGTTEQIGRRLKQRVGLAINNDFGSDWSKIKDPASLRWLVKDNSNFVLDFQSGVSVVTIL